MAKQLFLLDGMALVYRAHFALIQRPVLTAKGVNTSALFGFTQTLLDIRSNQSPTHLAVAFDTAVPTRRHREFPAYKIQREAMPEDIEQALPHVRRLVEAFNIPVLALDGYEADDLIGTLVRRAESHDFTSYMVTPDKDFAQLVTDRTFIYRPGRMGDPPEILGPNQVRQKWGVARPEQVIDILALWGDASDNIPGVPGIGEKTAGKLIAQYGSLENLLAHAAEIKGRAGQALTAYQEQARLYRHLVTIDCDVPLAVDLEALSVRPPNEEALKDLLVEFEFNSIGRRLFGESFQTGRGYAPSDRPADAFRELPLEVERRDSPSESLEVRTDQPAPNSPRQTGPVLRTLSDMPHDYRLVMSANDQAALLDRLLQRNDVGLAAAIAPADSGPPRLRGLAFVWQPCLGAYVPLPGDAPGAKAVLERFRPLLENERVGKTGHDLKPLLRALRRYDVRVRGPLFDVMLAHALIEPDLRHTLGFLAEALLGYSPRPPIPEAADATELDLSDPGLAGRFEWAVETADLAGQLRKILEPQLADRGQERVFYEIEAPLLPVLVEMEHTGIRVDARALGEFSESLSRRMSEHERAIYRLAGAEFNLNSPKQLGDVLFDALKLSDRPKKTRTGQYATDESTLVALAAEHEIVRCLLEYRACSKLKSTYADALPAAICSETGRVHTTYQQLATATGRLNSQNPNLQNIPIRTELGQEIRKAFLPRDAEHQLLSADYSQIELRIIAALCDETTMIQAFRAGADVHRATAARVFGVLPERVTPEMRKKAKMVNYGIAYGISAFGLAQRLGIPRREALEIIEHYFAQFPRIQEFMNRTIALARRRGYVETVAGRRRYIRDIGSSNATVRAAAERNAINAPIQGTAADMIKLAMIRIQGELEGRGLRSRMLLQVHDELVFDLYRPERETVSTLVEQSMRTALPLSIPLEVEVGIGDHWLEAH